MENEPKLKEEGGENVSLLPPLGDDYYIKKSRKVGDFCLGFFGTIIVPMVVTFLINLFDYIFNFNGEGILISLSSIGGLVAYLWLIIKFFRTGRRFISIGMLSIIIFGLLIFGGCLIFLAIAF